MQCSYFFVKSKHISHNPELDLIKKQKKYIIPNPNFINQLNNFDVLHIYNIYVGFIRLYCLLYLQKS